MSVIGKGRRGLAFEVARVTIETLSPLTIGTGGGTDLVDAVCVVDANGLPAIPGTSLAGVLRRAVAGAGDPHEDPRCRALFGFQDGTDGQASLVEVSWGQVHCEHDQPVPFRGANLSDPVLAFLAAGVVRDHVRIDQRGVADDRGKFDEELVPRGARFTFEIVVHAGAPLGARDLVDLLASEATRVGGRTRRGYGAFRVERAAIETFDLATGSGRKSFARLPRALHEPVPPGVLRPYDARPVQVAGRVTATLHLATVDIVRMGRGEPVRPEHTRSVKGVEKLHDAVPYTERYVTWDRQGRGRVAIQPEYLLTATGLKGALRHRTLFHAHRRARAWAPETARLDWFEDERKDPQDLASPAIVAEVDGLFGCAKSKKQSRSEDIAGRLFLAEAWLPDSQVTPVAMDHVALDRFTGGPRSGRLFSELGITPAGFVRFQLSVDTAGKGPAVSERARRAFADALADLCEGRLAIGAASARGHGHFEGMVVWEGDGQWIRGGEA